MNGEENSRNREQALSAQDGNMRSDDGKPHERRMEMYGISKSVEDTRRCVCKHIARIMSYNPSKARQVEKVASISSHLTSASSARVTCELYDGNIMRFVIVGTRSSATITANTITNEIVRKPRGAKPWYEIDVDVEIYHDIMPVYREMMEFHKRISE